MTSKAGRAPRGHGPRATVAAVALGGLAAVVLGCLMAPAAHAQADASRAAAATSHGGKRAAARPAWSELTPVQKEALAPLAADWHTLSEFHRRKWLQIAARYQKLPPADQQRARQRMEEWIRLTPQQRRLARENFQINRTVPAERKTEAWDRYQQLTEAQKRELAAADKVPPRPGAVSALPSGRKPATASTRTGSHGAGAASEPMARGASAPSASAPPPSAPSVAASAGTVADAASSPAPGPAEAVSSASAVAPDWTMGQ